MAVNWTKEQSDAISCHGTDILVSAAAGSGKTAVLVERILQMVIRKEQPIDVDHLLVVTFTKAAAGEMKERLMAALEQKREEEPDNEHLQKQSMYIHNAQINTIDGFCSYVIRNYFHLVNLDPGYRIVDEGELKLLKGDVIQEVLNQAYEEGGETFKEFVECYAPGKNDKVLEEQILQLYEASQSHPWPTEWLCDSIAAYDVQNWEEIAQSKWIQELWAMLEEKISECLQLTQESLDIALGAEGPDLYESALKSDQQLLEELALIKEYDKWRQCIFQHKWERLSTKRMPYAADHLKDRIKRNRETVKDMVNEIKEKYFVMTSQEILETMKQCYPAMKNMISLTLRFAEAFAEKKRQKNLLDFADVEHLALSVLVECKDGIYQRTEAAKELSERFEEIMIDEYQDSNYVQEMILSSVSRHEDGVHNIFMVGDVKQSIYRFRLANPELFMEKYEAYVQDENEGKRIDLHQNFRSRKEVLDFANLIFSRVMNRELGGVAYDESAALHAGAQYPESDQANAEILILNRDSASMKELGLKGSEKELEARMIGQRIQQLIKNGQVYDAKTREYRKVRYSDCVILLRSISGYGDVFGKVLQGMRIPAHVTSRTGYFDTLEIVTLLNYLHICDNPRQDIPFAAILHSPIVKISAAELTEIRLKYPEGSMYEGSRKYSEFGENRNLVEKLQKFFESLDLIRSVVPFTPIHQLIQLILEQTGYGEFVKAMPAGEQRFANVSMLKEKARAYEKTSYRGLFNFIRYIEQLQKYQIDFGEVNIVGENENTVRIMTIHKSKGLEFPIVFLAGMGKKFNLLDLNSAVIIHPTAGLAVDYVDHKRRIKIPTLFKQFMKRKLLIENLSEEMRILYVAMTRAKEKLILTGTISNFEKKMESFAPAGLKSGCLLPGRIRENGRDYWSWVLPALQGHDQACHFHIITPEMLTFDEAKSQLDREMNKVRLTNWDCNFVWDEGIRKLCDERFSYQYPFGLQKNVPVKVTVSELKKVTVEDEIAEDLFFEPDIIPLVPRFIELSEEQLTGADRGSAYHRAFELFDYSCVNSKEEIEKQLKTMKQEEKLSDAMYNCLAAVDFQTFIQSEIGHRMQSAALEGRLYREQPFTMSIPASEKNPAYSDCDSILVQGIIDAFFFEDDEIILVDYKTDNVYRVTELVNRYHKQLEYYSQALERTTGKKVKERIIYSVTLGKEISC